VTGLVGVISEEITEKKLETAVERTLDLIIHFSFYKKDKTFSKGKICASRSHIGVHQISQTTGFSKISIHLIQSINFL